MSGQLDAPAAIRLGTHRIGGWVDPRVGLDKDLEEKKIPTPAGNRNPCGPVHSRVTILAVLHQLM
jgi:hypothetical protein